MRKRLKICPHGINQKYCRACKGSAFQNRKRAIPQIHYGLSPDQDAAVRTILSEKGPFFLTGLAGTGKSHVIRYLKRICRNATTTAMTGIAAQLIDGTSRTAHSFLGIYPIDDGTKWQNKQDGLPDASLCFKPVKPNRHGEMIDYVDRDVAKTDLLIIDEFSMASTEFLDLMLKRLEQADLNEGHRPKLLVVGDILQLPPTDGQRFFLSEAIKDFKVLQLTKQHRQSSPSEEKFLKALNEIRVGIPSKESLELLQSRIVNELPRDCTHLHPKNYDVDRTNEARLSAIPSEEYEIQREINWGDLDRNDPDDSRRMKEALSYKARDNPRLSETLKVKVGARVMLLTNDQEGRWVNGSTGTISSIEPLLISVKLDWNGNEVFVEKAEDDIYWGKDKIGSVRQFPMRLAWALTIHKCQGATMDRVGVDLDDHFSEGMTYVALSRCRTLNGLFLKGTFPNPVKVDKSALSFLRAYDPSVPEPKPSNPDYPWED